MFEIVPSADGRRLAMSIPGSALPQGVLLDVATGQPVGPDWLGSGFVSAPLPDGGFLVDGVRSALAPQRHRRAARTGDGPP